MFLSHLLIWMGCGLAWGQEPADDAAKADAVRMHQGDQELMVYADLFARWDGTRWFLETESTLPYSLLFSADQNLEFPTQGYQTRAIIACEKDWKLGKLRYEVNCKVEDFGIQATSSYSTKKEKDRENALIVLEQLDAKLSGATIQIQVLADGRVDNVDIEGISTGNRRINRMNETMRVLVGRMMSGFHLKLRKMNQLNEGRWVEFDSTVLSMPGQAGMTPSHSSHTVHYLNRFEGNTLVQTIGRGMVSMPTLRESVYGANATRMYQTDLIGVSIFDYEEGFMLERVWAVEGELTAAFLADGGYWFAGRIKMLGEGDEPDVGPTRLIAARGQAASDLPPWIPIER
jgi:hypothetical protein